MKLNLAAIDYHSLMVSISVVLQLPTSKRYQAVVGWSEIRKFRELYYEV